MKLLKTTLSFLLFEKLSIVFLVLMTIGFISSCGSGELTRSKAQSLIENSNDFRQISTLNVVTPSEVSMKQRGGGIIKRTSDTDTPEKAMKRDLEYYFEFDTDVGLAKHLDFLKVEQKLIKEQPRNPSLMFGSYKVDSTTRTSEKGQALWDEVEVPEGINVSKDTELPLAKKEIVEITGINKRNDTNATAEFIYKWNPYKLGRYMDANYDEHKSLPEEIKKSLEPSNQINRGNNLKDWNSTRKGIAVFQKYDDGWRLQMVRF